MFGFIEQISGVQRGRAKGGIPQSATLQGGCIQYTFHLALIILAAKLALKQCILSHLHEKKMKFAAHILLIFLSSDFYIRNIHGLSDILPSFRLW